MKTITKIRLVSGKQIVVDGLQDFIDQDGKVFTRAYKIDNRSCTKIYTVVDHDSYGSIFDIIK